MLIVPEDDKLIIEARIAPFDIDQVLQSKEALIRFSAFNQRTTPEIIGTIAGISADLTKDQQTGESYFTVRIRTSDEELAKLGDKKLVPGMPADVQIRTQDRTALSYLVKPLQDQIARAFRER
jgi:HlyD family secretion protein